MFNGKGILLEYRLTSSTKSQPLYTIGRFHADLVRKSLLICPTAKKNIFGSNECQLIEYLRPYLRDGRISEAVPFTWQCLTPQSLPWILVMAGGSVCLFLCLLWRERKVLRLAKNIMSINICEIYNPSFIYIVAGESIILLLFLRVRHAPPTETPNNIWSKCVCSTTTVLPTRRTPKSDLLSQRTNLQRPSWGTYIYY